METAIISVIISILGVGLISSFGFSMNLLLKRIDSLDNRMDNLDTKIDNLDTKIDTKIDILSGRIDGLSNRVTALETKVDMIIPHIQQQASGTEQDQGVTGTDENPDTTP